ncbi:MAG: cell division protein FtsL [Tumebacillaceae bacterium]
MSMYRDNLARSLPKQQETPKYAPTAPKVNRSAESKAQAKEKIKWLGTVVFCIAVSLVLVSRYAGMVSLNYQIQEGKDSLQKVLDNNLKLEAQALQLESPDRIKDFAQNKLGMHSVTDKQIVVLPGGSH